MHLKPKVSGQLYLKRQIWQLWRLRFRVLLLKADVFALKLYILEVINLLRIQCKQKVYFRGKILLGNEKLLQKTFFAFGSTCRIFVSAKYLADNFRTNTHPKTFSADHNKFISNFETFYHYKLLFFATYIGRKDIYDDITAD
jgi:hypothetical protein